MSKFLILIGSVFACILTALIVAPRLVDWNHFRGMLEGEASRLLGREVSVRGEVNLRLLPTPYIRFDEIRVADGPTGGRAAIFKADGFTVWLAVGPLFRGVLEASRVELIRPVVTLVTDRSGGGSWNSLLANRTRYAFAPASVALRAVHITDGAVVVQTTEGDEQARLEIATGEFSAAALEGPYKLHAALKSPERDSVREVRLSTAKPEADGNVRFKGTLRTSDGRHSYALDGQVVDLAGHTRISGELIATLPLPAADGAAASGSAASGNEHHGFDLRATLNADTAGLALSDVSLSFDNQGRPQLVTGEARLAWRRASSMIRFEARWLDLDRIAGHNANTAPLLLLSRLATGLDRLMPVSGRTDASLTLDQATLGGDVVSGLRLEIAKENGALKLNGLRASLPAGARLETSGHFTREKQEIAFDGDVMVRGPSLNRFLAWARRGPELPELKQDGSFTMRGQVSVGAGRFAGRDMILQLGGNSLTGSASWSEQGKSRLLLAVEGSELDVGPLLGKDFRLSTLTAMFLTRAPSETVPRAPSASALALKGEAAVQMRVSRLVAGSTMLRDVVVDIAADQDTFKISALKFSSDDGFTGEFSGSVAGLMSNSPKGSIGGHVSATRGAGVIRLAELLGLSNGLQPSRQRAEVLGPMRLAGTFTVGARATRGLDLAIDGMLGDSRLTARAQMENLQQPWREQRVDVTASLDGQELSTLLAQVLPAPLGSDVDKGARTPARATLKAVGVPARDLVSVVTLDAAGLSGDYRGRFAVGDGGVKSGTGQIGLKADDLGRTLALLGLISRGKLEGLSAQLRLEASLEAKRLGLKASRVTFGEAVVGGYLDVNFGAERPHVAGRIRTNEVSLPRLIAMVAGPVTPTVQAQQGSVSESPSPWPDTPIDLRYLADVDADVQIEASRANLTADIAVTEATLEADVAGGRATLKLADSRALAGRATGRLSIGRTPAGISLEGDARLAKGALEAFVSGERPAATGEFSMELNFASVAVSPRGLITGMRGKGAITIGDGRLYRMAPSAVGAAATEALAVPAEELPTVLKKRLREGLATGAQSLGPRRIALELTDGVVRFEPLTLDAAEARITANTTVDFESMKFDSEWRIDPKSSGSRLNPGKGALPGVSLVYVGELARLGSVEPRLRSEALERELGVRKMERYVDELERIRRQDEENVRREVERQRMLEQERQRQELERLLRRSAAEQGGGVASSSGGNAPSTVAPSSSEGTQGGTSYGSGAETRRQVPTGRSPTPGNEVQRYWGGGMGR